MFSQTAEYALRAMAFLAERGERPHAIPEIASATLVPPDYLSKVMQGLVKSGLAEARRGRTGGYALARPASETTILGIINAVDPIQRLTKCPLGLPQHAALCPLHRRLDAAAAHVEAAFQNTSLADLLSEPIFPESKP